MFVFFYNILRISVTIILGPISGTILRVSCFIAMRRSACSSRESGFKGDDSRLIYWVIHWTALLFRKKGFNYRFELTAVVNNLFSSIANVQYIRHEIIPFLLIQRQVGCEKSLTLNTFVGDYTGTIQISKFDLGKSFPRTSTTIGIYLNEYIMTVLRGNPSESHN